MELLSSVSLLFHTSKLLNRMPVLNINVTKQFLSLNYVVSEGA